MSHKEDFNKTSTVNKYKKSIDHSSHDSSSCYWGGYDLDADVKINPNLASLPKPIDACYVSDAEFDLLKNSTLKTKVF